LTIRSPLFDLHTHLHPPWLFAAIGRWFAERGWGFVHPTDPAEVAERLQAYGTERFCFFSYAHRAGMARELNRWLAEQARRLPQGIPLGTFHLDDPDYLDVVDEALDGYGFRGLKAHINVQRFYPDDPRALRVWERLAKRDRILLIHVSRLPYPNAYVGMKRFAGVMERFPTLRACVAHMGGDESEACFELMARFPNLYLDTTMALSSFTPEYMGFDPAYITTEQLVRWQDRVCFGSDFPIVPYGYEAEMRGILDRELPEAVERKIFSENARRFLGTQEMQG
jgi:predicted TIM-barrel fold metal-dependent hydrolase